MPRAKSLVCSSRLQWPHTLHHWLDRMRDKVSLFRPVYVELKNRCSHLLCRIATLQQVSRQHLWQHLRQLRRSHVRQHETSNVGRIRTSRCGESPNGHRAVVRVINLNPELPGVSIDSLCEANDPWSCLRRYQGIRWVKARPYCQSEDEVLHYTRTSRSMWQRRTV